MRNLLIILILIFPSLMLSQSATKWQQKNADKISSYVIEKMDLNTKDAAFFSKAQLAQIVENANNIKDDNCTDGKITGALLGGGLGGAISRKEGRWFAVPLGAVTGAAIGNKVDGC